MKQLSYWAKDHKWAARVSIVGIYIILDVLAFYWATLLIARGTIITPIVILLFSLIFCVAAALYPGRRVKGKLGCRFYSYQKTCDVVLVLTSVLLMMSLFNNLGGSTLPGLAKASSMFSVEKQKDTSIKKYMSIENFSKTIKDSSGRLLSWKLRKIELKQQLNNIHEDEETPAGVKALLIVLSIGAALGLMYLLAGLACSLSCSGSDALAAIVMFGGGAGVILLTVVVIKAILRPKRPALG